MRFENISLGKLSRILAKVDMGVKLTTGAVNPAISITNHANGRYSLTLTGRDK
jgi:hypothetical protein